ncbi:hypothetical protein ACLOJK_034537, partial [Asimina triloba]
MDAANKQPISPANKQPKFGSQQGNSIADACDAEQRRKSRAAISKIRPLAQGANGNPVGDRWDSERDVRREENSAPTIRPFGPG